MTRPRQHTTSDAQDLSTAHDLLCLSINGKGWHAPPLYPRPSPPVLDANNQCGMCACRSILAPGLWGRPCGQGPGQHPLGHSRAAHGALGDIPGPKGEMLHVAGAALAACIALEYVSRTPARLEAFRARRSTCLTDSVCHHRKCFCWRLCSCSGCVGQEHAVALAEPLISAGNPAAGPEDGNL